jgi:hypothetical protein
MLAGLKVTCPSLGFCLSESDGAVAGDTTALLTFKALSPERVEQVWQACVMQEDGHGTSSVSKKVS